MFWNHHKVVIKHFSQMKFLIEEIRLCPVNAGARWIHGVCVDFSKYIASEIIYSVFFFFFFFSDLERLFKHYCIYYEVIHSRLDSFFFLLWDYISSHLQTFFKALKVIYSV